MKQLARNWLLPGLLALSTFSADFATKSWANTHLEYGQPVAFLPGFLQLTLTRNSGAAFGIGRGQGGLMTILACLILLAIIIWLVAKERSKTPLGAVERCGAGIIVGAALGNLFDRLTRHEVTDFLEFCFVSFPVFNLADALIDVGAGLVIIGALFLTGDAAKEKRQERE